MTLCTFTSLVRRCAVTAVLILPAACAERETVSPLPEFPVSLEFGTSFSDVRMQRPNARLLPYAGLVETRARPGIEEISYRFAPSTPPWLERRFGRLTAVHLVLDDGIASDSVSRALTSRLGPPSSTWCSPTAIDAPGAELQYERWESAEDRPQQITLRSHVRQGGPDSAATVTQTVLVFAVSSRDDSDLGMPRQRCRFTSVPDSAASS